MDNIPLNKTFESDGRSPLKELYPQNNILENISHASSNGSNLMDEDITFLDKTVLPTTSQSDVDTTFDRSVENNQKSVRLRYSLLNSFDPIIKKENDVNPLDCINETAPSSEKTFVLNTTENSLDSEVNVSVNEISEQTGEPKITVEIPSHVKVHECSKESEELLKSLEGLRICDPDDILENSKEEYTNTGSSNEVNKLLERPDNTLQSFEPNAITENCHQEKDKETFLGTAELEKSLETTVSYNSSDADVENLQSTEEAETPQNTGEISEEIEGEKVPEDLGDNSQPNSTFVSCESVSSAATDASSFEKAGDSIEENEESVVTVISNKSFDVNVQLAVCETDSKTEDAKKMSIDELAERVKAAEAKREKYKTKVNDLTKELKICQENSISLEKEVTDCKCTENELKALLEEHQNRESLISTDLKTKEEDLKQSNLTVTDLRNKVHDLQVLISKLETDLKEEQKKEVKLAGDLINKTESEAQISRITEEYEKSISKIVAENEKLKKERDTAQMHLANIELAFSDVHQKYERCKAVIQGYKDTEESFRQDITMNRETIAIQEQKYETLKAHAMAQLEKSNQELAALKKQHETEISKLTAQLKRCEIRNISLVESLQQKTKECEQLSKVCDEFIGNV